MNLIVEQGNTAMKIAVYKDDMRVLSMVKESSCDLSWLEGLCVGFEITQAIMSSVGNTDVMLKTYLQDKISYFLWLDEKVPVPISVGYATKDTLGKDRLAAAVAVHHLQPERDVLVIDAGTAVTYEVVEKSGLYVGGNISPGMTTRFRALNHYTNRLPLLKEQEDVPLIGTDTESAIVAGVVNGMVYEMDGYIDSLKGRYGDIFVFLTGGHSFYFERRLKNPIFADANLVLFGLNVILEYNAKKI